MSGSTQIVEQAWQHETEAETMETVTKVTFPMKVIATVVLLATVIKALGLNLKDLMSDVEVAIEYDKGDGAYGPVVGPP